MNSMERILATIGGMEVGRRAVAPVLGLYGARLTDCPMEQYYTDPAAYARGQAAVYETFRPDVLCGPLAFALFGAAFGSDLHFSAMDVPKLKRPAVLTVAEWDQLVLPDPDTHHHLLFFREAIKRMAGEHQGEIAVAAVIPTLPEIPIMIFGLDAWMEIVLFDRPAAERVAERLLPLYLKLVNGFFAAGATFIVMPAAFAASGIVTREIVQGFTLPVLQRMLAQIEGPVVLHSVGTPMLSHLDLLVGLPSVVAFSLDHLDDLNEARRIVGGSSVLFGGIDCSKIALMSPEQVRRQARAILANRRDDPRFILGTSGPDVALTTPPENIHALHQAAEAFAEEGR